MKGALHEVLDSNFGALFRQRVFPQSSRVFRQQPSFCPTGRRREVGEGDLIEAPSGEEGCSVGVYGELLVADNSWGLAFLLGC
jgi:hypothetical protein